MRVAVVVVLASLAAAAAPFELRSLAGSEWGDDAGGYIQFGSEGRIIGNGGGCNRLAGSYSASADGRIEIRGATTRMGCPPAQARRENAFYGALRKARRFRATHLQLRLYDENGKELLFLKRRDFD